MIRRCPRCGSNNRVPASKLDRAPRCGRCHTNLGVVSEPVPVATTAELDDLVANAPVPVLVDFWATWCGPCHAVAPELDRIAREYAGDAVVAKVDTDRLPELASRYGIRGVPTMILFRAGHESSRIDGALPAAEIARRLGL